MEIKLPELGEGITSAQVSNLLVAVGDTVAKDQALIEVETDKATAEVPAPFGGVVRELRVQKGETLAVGQIFAVVEAAAATVATETPPTSAVAPGAPPIASSASASPAPSRSPSPMSATPMAAPAKPPAPSAASAESPSAPQPSSDAERRGSIAAAPSVRRLARELGVELENVVGTGPEGRISAEDVKTHIRTVLATRAAAPALSPEVHAEESDIEREPMSMVRKKTAEKMAAAWGAVPHVTQFDRADVTALEGLRKQFGLRVEAAGGKLTMTAIVAKIVALGLRRFPKFNSTVDLERSEVVYHKRIHVGVAVDTPRGLLVPVIRDVDQKGIERIAVELHDAAERARNRKSGVEELRGGTFSISNLGALGTTYFTPLVNWPEVAVLGLGRAEIQPVWQKDAFVPRRILPLSLSYDHRVIDGADAARFLRWLAEGLEEPFILQL